MMPSGTIDVIHDFDIPADPQESEQRVFDRARKYADQYMAKKVQNSDYEIINYGNAQQGNTCTWYFCINRIK